MPGTERKVAVDAVARQVRRWATAPEHRAHTHDDVIFYGADTTNFYYRNGIANSFGVHNAMQFGVSDGTTTGEKRGLFILDYSRG